MQAAVTRGRKKSPLGSSSDALGALAEDAPEIHRLLSLVRQGYLDALPIAAAMITIAGDESFIECANEHFRSIAEWDERLGERRISQIPKLRSGLLGSRLAAF